MKHLLTLLLMAISFGSMAQITVTTPKAGTKQATTNQAYLYKNTGGDTTRLYLRLGAPGITAAYYEIGGGGGSLTLDTNRLMFLDKNQTSTGYKSFTGRAAVSNSGNLTGNALDVFSNSGSLSAIEANNGAGGLAIKAITTNATAFETTNVSAASPSGKFINISSGPHAQFGGTTGKIATVTNSGNIITPKASASNHVVIKSQLDSAVAGITIDTSALARKSQVNRIIKDFYNDSVVFESTAEKMLYADTLAANTLTNNGDKLVFHIGGHFETVTSSKNYFTVKFGGVVLASFPATAFSAGFRPFSLTVTMIKAGGTELRAKAEFIYENSADEYGAQSDPFVSYYQGSLFSFTGSNILGFFGELESATVSTIRARMGYIEFKPAAL